MNDWRRLTTDSSATVLEAMRVIDAGGLQYALVLNDGRLVGVATDGDIRRAIMRGVNTGAPISQAMNAGPVTGMLGESPADWRRKIRAHRIRYLPIVDASGQLIRVVTERSCAQPRENWAVVMAGGLGTRLRPMTEQIPKPMIEIGGAPILETILHSLTSAGISRIYFAVNYRADVIVDYFGNGDRWDVQIEYLHEPERMGTAGALSLLPVPPSAPLMVLNGDILSGLDYGLVLDDHSRSAAVATMCVREYATQIPYGVVEVAGERLLGITEKPVMTHLASAGVYALSPRAVSLVPEAGQFDMPALFQQLLQAGEAVRVHHVSEYWIDIGRVDDLERARAQFGKEQ